MQRILVADDDEEMRAILARALAREGFEVVATEDGAGALETHRAWSVDLMVLGLAMPGMGGFQVLRELRPGDTVPVLVLAGAEDERQRLEGFGLGADDFLLKPVSPPELIARIRAILRRTAPSRAPQALRSGPFELDLMSKCLSRDGVPVALSPMELQILRPLMAHAGDFLSRPALLDMAWPRDAHPSSPKTVDVHMMHIRRKLKRAGDPDWITATPRCGYCWTAPVREALGK